MSSAAPRFSSWRISGDGRPASEGISLRSLRFDKSWRRPESRRRYPARVRGPPRPSASRNDLGPLMRAALLLWVIGRMGPTPSRYMDSVSRCTTRRHVSLFPRVPEDLAEGRPLSTAASAVRHRRAPRVTGMLRVRFLIPTLTNSALARARQGKPAPVT